MVSTIHRAANQAANHLANHPIKKVVYIKNESSDTHLYNLELWKTHPRALSRCVYGAVYHLLALRTPELLGFAFGDVPRCGAHSARYLRVCRLRRYALCLSYHLSGLSRAHFASLHDLAPSRMFQIIDRVVEDRDTDPALDLFLDEVERAVLCGDYGNVLEVYHEKCV